MFDEEEKKVPAPPSASKKPPAKKSEFYFHILNNASKVVGPMAVDPDSFMPWLLKLDSQAFGGPFRHQVKTVPNGNFLYSNHRLFSSTSCLTTRLRNMQHWAVVLKIFDFSFKAYQYTAFTPSVHQ